MPTYITFFRLTQKGMQNIRKSPERLDTAKRAFRSLGVHLKAFYLLMGQYDAVVISEAPDDETAARAALSLGAAGYVRSDTHRAFTEEEYRDIIASLG